MESEFREELDRLQRRLRRMSTRQSDLERRLQRIENSTIFRLLRWAGPRLAALGVPVPGVLKVDEAEAYQAWIQGVPSCDAPPAGHLPAISVILDATGAERARLERALASIRNQSYGPLDLLVWCDGTAPAWLEHAGSRSLALQSVRGEAILWTNSDVILEPDALRALAAAFDEKTVAVYSDWDHVDADGRRHSPRFTPEFSPELLLQTSYWGDCWLSRADHFREMPRPESLSEVTRDRVRRIPRILWHSQKPAAISVQQPFSRPASSARASVIICSRNPARLARCLKALRPTLDPRHEIVVVAHAVAHVVAHNADFGPVPGATKVVPYRGAFHFGAMNALGVRESTGEVLCFLNDDVFPTASGWLETMLAHVSAQAARPEIGIVGALLLYPDGSIQHAGVVVDRWHPAHVGRFQRASYYWPWLRMTREVSAVTGACMVLRRSTWNELGGFDPAFPVNYNDIDLCLRAAARGYRILLESRAILIHEEARTRVAVVRPEEAEKFQDRWSAVTDRPDPYFNPQLSAEDETIRLRD